MAKQVQPKLTHADKLTPLEIKTLEELGIVDELDDKEFRAYVYSKGFYNIEWFTDHFLGHYKVDKKTGVPIATADLHRTIWDTVNTQDSVIIVPRDHAKSTSLFFYLVWNICYEVDPEILLIMSEALSASTIGKIRDEFEENGELKFVFGRLVPNKSRKEANKEWTRKKLSFLNGIKIAALSKGASMRWLRPTLILVDDPQEDDDVVNKQVTDKFNAWFFNTVYNMLDDSGRCIVVWTVIWPLCFVQYLKQEGRWFNLIEHTAIKNIEIQELKHGKPYRINGKLVIGDGKKHIVWGIPLWKEKWSIEALDRRYQKLLTKNGDDSNFMQEYMNIPMILNGRPFYPRNVLRNITPLQTYKRDTVYEDLFIYWPMEIDGLIWVDVAEWLVTGDFSVIRFRSRKTGNLIASYRGHVDPSELPKVIDRIYKLWWTARIGIEKNNHGLTTIRFAEQYEWKEDMYRRTDIDKITKKKRQEYGWLTNSKTRPVMLDEHKEYVKNGDIDIDEVLHNEMQYFYRNEKGKPEALANSHDDVIMADAICMQMMPYPIFTGVKI